MPNEPLVTDGHLRRFRFDERLLFGRRFFTPFGRGGRLAYSGATSGRGTTARRWADKNSRVSCDGDRAHDLRLLGSREDYVLRCSG